MPTNLRVVQRLQADYAELRKAIDELTKFFEQLFEPFADFDQVCLESNVRIVLGARSVDDFATV